MIAISSHRPFEESNTIAKHQCDAKATWEPVFEEIIYFGKEEPALASSKTVFIPWEGKPPIKEMASIASKGFGWRCLINADIQIDPRVKRIDKLFSMMDAKCALSFRIPIGKTQREDLGLDFFVADVEVWRQVALVIPKEFTIGRQQFDTWLASFFMKHWPHQCYDLSPSKLIWHPVHEERKDQTLIINDPYIKNMRWTAKPWRF